MHQILRIDASARVRGSVSRRLGDRIEHRLLKAQPRAQVIRRDLAPGAGTALPPVDADWIRAGYTEPDQRDPGQREHLALSDHLIGELRGAGAVILTSPVYNFSIPSPLKAWIDLVCRARETFRYGPAGPEGLLADRPVYLALATGGTAIGSAIDFASGYLRHILGFIGLQDVRVLAADRLNADAEAALARAEADLIELMQDRAA